MATTFAQQLLPSYQQCDQDPIYIRDYNTLHDNDVPPDVPDTVKIDFDTKHKLQVNKELLKHQFDEWGVPQERRVLMTAMAMQETRHMDVEERDKKKDKWCPEYNPECNKCMDNATIFNLSKDLIQKTGFYNIETGCYDMAGNVNQNAVKGQFRYLTNAQFDKLCRPEGLHDAVGILSWAFDLWGIEDTLAFVRCGGDAFDPNNPCYCKNVSGQPTGSQWRNICQANGREQKVYDNVVFYLRCIKRMMQFIDGDERLLTDGRRPDIDCPRI
jgi:hypothetical protein